MSKSKKHAKENLIQVQPKKADFVCELDEDAVTVENNGKIYELSMDVRSFSPTEIKIKLSPTHILIEGLHETDEEVSEFNEELAMPKGVTPSSIEVTMNGKGVLRIRAPIVSEPDKMSTKLVSSSVKKEVVKTESRRVEEIREEIEVRTEVMDVATEAKVMKDAKYVDTTKDLKRNDGKMEMSVDLSGHKEKDIKVSVSQRVVAIQAVSTDSESRTKDIHKKFLIPDGVDPTSFKTFLKKGVLTMEANDPKQGKPEKPAPKREKPVTLKSEILADDAAAVKELEKASEDVTQSTSTATAHKDRFEAKLNVAGCKHEELRVKMTKKVIIVHTESTSSSKSTTKQYCKRLYFPAGVSPESVTNSLGTDDVLTFSASIQAPAKVEPPQMQMVKEIKNASAAGKLDVEFDVTGYNKSEVEVKVSKSVVTVKGEKKASSENQLSMQFFKKFSIPQGVRPECIKWDFTSTTLKVYSVQEEVKSGSSAAKAEVQGVQVIKPKIVQGGMGSTSVQLVSTGSEITKFERKVEAAGYSPEEIEIIIANGWITINGKQQLGAELNFQTRQFTKKFSIPFGVDPKDICCTVDAKGSVLITSGK